MKDWHGTPDTGWDAAQRELEALGLADGLPVVPPTRARVDAMLAGSGFPPGEVLCHLAPMLAPASWHDIAVNAVMAGCLPGYLPVIGAALAAMAAPEFNLTGITTTTGSAAPLVLVGGPVAARIGMNGGANALGPGNRANATIGRAVSLCLRNIGGAAVGEVDMATLGQPAKYSCCFAESSDSPWPPLHAARGYAASDSVVTVIGVSGTVEVVDSSSSRGADIAQTWAQSMLIAGTVGGAGMLGGGEPLVIMSPEQAAACARDGHTRETLRADIFERAVMPAARLAPAVRESLAGRGAGGDLRVAQRPEDILIVVAGGVGVKGAYAPTWGGGTRAVSRRVR